MSSDFPTHAEVGERNVREYLKRTREFDELMTCAPAEYFRVPLRVVRK